MEFDDVAWEKSENTDEAWKEHFSDDDTLREIGHLILKYRGGVPDQIHSPWIGGFNVLVRLEFQDGGSAIARFPCPGSHPFPEEKTIYEVAAMRYINEHTTIPVPLVLHHGTAEESPRNIGPFLIMEYIENAGTASKILNTPGFGFDDRPILDPNIAKDDFEGLYSQIVDILLQLSKCSFPRIGSLVQPDDDHWLVNARPLTYNMNALVELGDVDPKRLPSTTFATASAYFKSLADMHIEHLSSQHNDAVYSAQDCRIKYIGRQLFRKLAEESMISVNGSFKLFCDDLRPSNMLVNEANRIVAVIDREFTYAAPPSFAHSPPWWLLLEMPEYWAEGLDEWAEKYEKRLGTFLKMLEQKEDEFIRLGKLAEDERLSPRMQQSWQTGDFWINYAARKSWAFDSIYWRWIDERFFGGDQEDSVDERLEKRLAILGDEERVAIDSFVGRKLEESKDRKLVVREGV